MYVCYVLILMGDFKWKNAYFLHMEFLVYYVLNALVALQSTLYFTC